MANKSSAMAREPRAAANKPSATARTPRATANKSSAMAETARAMAPATRAMARIAENIGRTGAAYAGLSIQVKEMLMSNDYVPSRDADFNAWFRNIVDYVGEKTGEVLNGWPNVPADAALRLAEAMEDWLAHYEITLHPHTPAQTQAKNDARKRAEAVIRLFVRQYAHFDPVTNEDRVNMGIPVRDVIRTDHHDVTEHLEMTLAVNAIREIRVHVKIKDASHNAKPAGYDGAVLIWALLPAPPKDISELSRHTMASRPSHTLRFEESDRGRTAYISGAWQNARGNLGPFSEILSTIVP